MKFSKHGSRIAFWMLAHHWAVRTFTYPCSREWKQQTINTSLLPIFSSYFVCRITKSRNNLFSFNGAFSYYGFSFETSTSVSKTTKCFGLELHIWCLYMKREIKSLCWFSVGATEIGAPGVQCAWKTFHNSSPTLFTGSPDPTILIPNAPAIGSCR